MNNATKKKLTSATQKDLTSGNACWQTAPLIYKKLNADFGPFDVDLTADGSNHLCSTWLGPGSLQCEDALKALWMEHGTNGYSNPPYGPFIGPTLAKAKWEAAAGFQSTLLLPMRVTKAFLTHVLDGAAELWFCDHRLCFFENGVPRINVKQWTEKHRAVADAAVFDSIIVRYLPVYPGKAVLKVGTWAVPNHVTKQDLERAASRMIGYVDVVTKETA